jgi:hypothetical protein
MSIDKSAEKPDTEIDAESAYDEWQNACAVTLRNYANHK